MSCPALPHRAHRSPATCKWVDRTTNQTPKHGEKGKKKKEKKKNSWYQVMKLGSMIVTADEQNRTKARSMRSLTRMQRIATPFPGHSTHVIYPPAAAVFPLLSSPLHSSPHVLAVSSSPSLLVLFPPVLSLSSRSAFRLFPRMHSRCSAALLTFMILNGQRLESLLQRRRCRCRCRTSRIVGSGWGRWGGRRRLSVCLSRKPLAVAASWQRKKGKGTLPISNIRAACN